MYIVFACIIVAYPSKMSFNFSANSVVQYKERNKLQNADGSFNILLFLVLRAKLQ